MKRQVRDTLLGFDGSRKQTSVLFVSLREVVQCLSGDDDPAARDAAKAFVLTVLLSPDANHYTALATEPGATPAQIKDHYRLLVRMVHPDFAAAGGPDWPEGAAARLNQAYETLSDAQARAHYDSSLRAGRRAARATRAPAHARRSHGSPRTVLRSLATSFGLLGAGGLAFLYWVGGRDDAEQLVQREPTTVVAMASSSTFADARDTTQVDVAPAAPAMAEAPAVQLAASTDASPGPLARLTRGLDITLAGLTPAPAAAQAAALPVVAVPDTDTGHAAPAKRQPEAASIVIAATASAPAPESAQPASTPPPQAVPAPTPVRAAPPREAASRPELAFKEAAMADGTPTMRDAQPYIVRLLEQLEAGRPDRVMDLIDGEGRNSPGATAFVRQYSSLVRGGRAAHMLGLHLQSTGTKGRLIVKGRVNLEFRDEQDSVIQGEFPIEAVFERRGDSVVLTGLGTGS